MVDGLRGGVFPWVCCCAYCPSAAQRQLSGGGLGAGSWRAEVLGECKGRQGGERDRQ